MPEEQEDRELKRLIEGMRQFRSDQVPRILATEVVQNYDERSQSEELGLAKAKDLAVLAEKGLFKVVFKEDIPAVANVIDGTFVLSLKNTETEKETYKARFLVQGRRDVEKNILLHSSTNIKQSSVRLFVALAAVFGFRIWSQDVSEVYLQCADKLMQDIYLKPTKEFNLSSDQLLKLFKLLYGLSDSGDYWHHTFTAHLNGDLNMTSTTDDLFLFFKTVHGKLYRITGTYVDDTVGAGSEEFV